MRQASPCLAFFCIFDAFILEELLTLGNVSPGLGKFLDVKMSGLYACLSCVN